MAILILVAVFFALFRLVEKHGSPREETAIIGKKKAMYPPVSKKLLYRKPTGVVLGKWGGKYVCKDLKIDGHVALLGGSGSGKSACHVIPSMLANPSARIFALDIKGELSFKATKYGDEHVLIFDPQDRTGYGYNPLFGLDKNSTQEILERLQTISFSLISLPANLKDPFWKISARNLLLGLLIYYFKQGKTEFIAIIDEILGKPIKTSIQEVMECAMSDSVEYRYIVQFAGMADETLGGIVAEMQNHLVVFANDEDIRYAFSENGCRISPMKLEEGYSIYLRLMEEKLTAYQDVLQLILNQTLSVLEGRPEGSEPILFVVDELPRILSAGKLEHLLDGARTLRSRNVCLFLISQSLEALMSAYSENEVADLISNFSYIIVLSATSLKTQKSVCTWCGKYLARRQSWNGSGSNRKITVSFEEKDIVEPSELMTLPNTGEAILITPFGYNRVRKVPYYKDKFFKKISEEYQNYNKEIEKMKKEDAYE